MENKKLKPEIEFKELFANPVKLFGWIFVIVIVVLIGMGVFYIKNLNRMSFNSMPKINFDSLRVQRDVEQKKGGIMPAVDLSLAAAPSGDLIAKGKELFLNTCSSCHGESGEGNGPAGAALNPKPRNFHSAEGWINGRKFSEMYKTLQQGIPGTGMAAYEYLPPEDRFALIHFIRTFGDFPKVEDSEVAYLDAAYNLSKGLQVPNVIPIKKAMKIEETENSNLNLKNVSSFIRSQNSEGASLFNKYTINKEKALYTFINGKLWRKKNTFLAIIYNSSVDNGFSASAASLSKDELNLLYDFLVTAAKNSNG